MNPRVRSIAYRSATVGTLAGREFNNEQQHIPLVLPIEYYLRIQARAINKRFGLYIQQSITTLLSHISGGMEPVGIVHTKKVSILEKMAQTKHDNRAIRRPTKGTMPVNSGSTK